MKINVEYKDEKWIPVKMYDYRKKFHIRFMPSVFLPNKEEIWI